MVFYLPNLLLITTGSEAFTMKSGLPRINKGYGIGTETTREYVQRKIDGNKIPHYLSGHLCEREVYTPANYDKVREKYSCYITNHIDEINSACATHNKEVFLSFYNSALKTTNNDWVTARMIIHCCISEFSIGGIYSLFEWADNIMLDSLKTSPALNR